MLDQHPRLAVLTADIRVEPGDREDPICEEMRRSPLPAPAGVPGHPLLSFLAGASVVRRSAFEAAGGFSARLWLGGEEELLASDLARAGWQMSFLPEIVVHHEPSWRATRTCAAVTASATRCGSPGCAARRGGRCCGRPGWRVSVPRDRISLQGFLDAARGVLWVAVERRVVPAHVEAGYRLLEDSQRRSTARRYVS